MKPGLYSDMTHEEYNNLPAEIVRNSYLGNLAYCPAKARVDTDKDTPSLLRGRAAHSLILEGREVFESEFAVAPTCDRRYKKGKEIWEAFVAASPGKTVITEEDYIRIYGMSRAVQAHEFASDLLENGACEQTIIWKDPETGILCRCRPDKLPAGGYPIVIDLKGCKDASDYGFDKSIAIYRYFQQAGMYTEGMTQATGIDYNAFMFIAVEWDFPHRMGVVNMDPDYLAYGKQEFHRLLRLEKQCRKNNHWPHFLDSGARDAYLPAYLGR